MTITATRALAVGLVIGLTGCMEQKTEEPLQITQHNDSVVEGSYESNGIIIDFVAEMPREYVGVVDVMVRDKPLTVTVNAYTGVIEFDANKTKLTLAERDALSAFNLDISEYVNYAEDTEVMHESLLFHASKLFAAAPIQTTLHYVTEQVEGLGKGVAMGRGNDGKRCIKTGRTEIAKFDGDHGNHDEAWVVGSHGGQVGNNNYECMGRCGGGCGRNYDWTLDCLDHDACSRYYYSTTGIIDHNCGDEYSDAVDDYVSWWKRCRS